ncbi:uncharacterized protein [Coffea arabica]|uniref:ATP-dependent DNA helicase n=1 Tax=Coffea arabica TaxID=13443 RepID=A0A6P6U0T3_COFAR
MDKNAKRRKRYAEMSHSQKADLLCCRREQNASKKAATAVPSSGETIHFQRPAQNTRDYFSSTPLGYTQTGVVLVGAVDSSLLASSFLNDNRENLFTTQSEYVYTFRVQGQVYHFLDGLISPSDKSSRVQLYFFDTDEEITNRVQNFDKLRLTTLKLLMTILQQNPYRRFFKELRDVQAIETHTIILRCYPRLDQRVFNLPTASQVAAIWTEPDDELVEKSPHIQVYSHSNASYRVQSYYACYDPLQYPLLFPRGESGWHRGIKRVFSKRKKPDTHDPEVHVDFSSAQDPSILFHFEDIAAQQKTSQDYTVSARGYYCYRLQIRDNDDSMLLHSLRLFQQFVVGTYIKIETSRLDFHRKRQTEIRTKILQGILDSVAIGQMQGSRVGRRIVLPASFIGGPRDMRRRYLDAMTLVQRDKQSPCMRAGKCKNHYPKNFAPYTVHGEDSYACYRRRDDGRKIKVRKHELNNPWVIPYSPYLLALFDCHINVEICSTVKLVKYLYKYIFKGHDLISFNLLDQESSGTIDEINSFLQARWVSPSEALWRIYEFRLTEMNPTVYTLQVHFLNQQFVSFDKSSDLWYLLRKIDFSKAMLTEFFRMNKTNATAQNLKCLYRDFPRHFVWTPKTKTWSERSRRTVIGRLVTIESREGERYYLRLLLTHIPNPTSLDDLLMVRGHKTAFFREACLELGLLESDSYIEQALEEAAHFQMPYLLRSLFALLLFYCCPKDPKHLWQSFEEHLSSDYKRSSAHRHCTPIEIKRKVLQDINITLEHMGKNLGDYHFLEDSFASCHGEHLTKEIHSKTTIPIDPEDLLLAQKLNSGQRHAFDLILDSVSCSKGQAFFVDGPSGTGKTFLYRALLASLRSQGYVAIAVATSGVAASLLPGGGTAHSRFKIPLDFSK